jgi:hypothetical protein
LAQTSPTIHADMDRYFVWFNVQEIRLDDIAPRPVPLDGLIMGISSTHIILPDGFVVACCHMSVREILVKLVNLKDKLIMGGARVVVAGFIRVFWATACAV